MRWRRRQRRRRRRGGGGREGRSGQAGRQRQARGPERTADTTKEEGRRRAVSPRPHPDFRDFPLTLMISLTCRAGSVWSVGCRGRATTTRGRERGTLRDVIKEAVNERRRRRPRRKEGRTAPGSFPEGGREGAAAGRGCAGVRTILRRHSSPPVPSLLLPPCCLLAAAAIMPLRKSNNRVATTQTYNNTMPGRGGSQAGRREGRIGTGFPRSVALSWHGASP